MSQVNLSKQSRVDTSTDSIVIMNVIDDIPGGRSLDVTGITDEVIKAGHVIIEETATGVLKPLGISAGDYVALPGSHTYKGILISSVLTSKPLASIMVRGTVNEEAAVAAAKLPAYPGGAKSSLTHIIFTKN